MRRNLLKWARFGGIPTFVFLALGLLWAQTPDCGSFLAAYRGAEGFGIYRFDPPAYQPEFLVHGFGKGGWCNMPRVSADFKTLYFTTKTPDNRAVVLARLDLTNPKAKPEMLSLGQEVKPGSDYVYATPHPSGDWLVGSMRLGKIPGDDLFRLDLDTTGTPGNLSDFFHSPAWEGLPAFSPDGTMIAFIQSATLDPGTYKDGASSKAMQLVVAPVTRERKAGTLRILFKAPRFVEMPQWSPDGKNIVIQVSGWPKEYNIVQVDVASGKYKIMTTSPYDDYNPTYSADGRWILYAQKPARSTWKEYRNSLDGKRPFTGRSILAIPSDGGEPKLLFQTKMGFLWFPQAIR